MVNTLSMPETTSIAETGNQADLLDDITALHEAFHRRVLGFFLVQLRDRDAAFSLTQDTFLKVWRTRESFRGDCAVGTWLMRIAVNVLKDHVRGGAFKFWRKAEKSAMAAEDLRDLLPANDRNAEQMLAAQQRVAIVMDALKELPEKQRLVFSLRYLEEMELAEIAVAVGLPLSTVKTHLYRALDRVRTVVQDQERRTV